MSRGPTTRWLSIAVAATVACIGPDVPTRPLADRAAPIQTSGWTVRDEYRSLAERALGFTTLFVDSTGSLTINVASDSFGLADQQQVLLWVASYTGATYPVSSVRVRRVPYGYLTLDAWYQPFTRLLASVPSVTSTRIDDFRARIVITVATIADEAAVRRLATELGIPNDALDVEELEYAHPEVTLQEYVRPAYGGLLIGSTTDACTLGFNGYERDASGQPDFSKPVFMTASHCTGIGDSWGQPTVSSLIGIIIHDAPTFSGGDCPVGACQYADVAVGRYEPGVSQGYGIVEKTNLNSIVITGNTGVSGTVYGAVAGETVWKVGKTTGTTKGTVTSTCVNFQLKFPDPMILCGHSAWYGSGDGDSGAPVFIPYNPSQPNSTPRTVGIHSSRAGFLVRYYSPHNQILVAQSGAFYW